MSVRAAGNFPLVIPGNYTPGTMPNVAASNRMLAWDTTYNCYMQSDGTTWKPTSLTVLPSAVYRATSNASGLVNVTYAIPKTGNVPYVAPVLSPNPDSNQLFRLVSSDLNGFSVKVEKRTGITILGLDVLSLATANVNGQGVDILVADF